MISCTICFDQFNASNRRPKILPCGHTFCLICLCNLEATSNTRNKHFSCPNCKKVPKGRAVEFADNFVVLSHLEELATHSSGSLEGRFWCLRCRADGGRSCFEAGHTLRGLEAHRAQRLEEARRARQQVQEGVQQCLQGLHLQGDAQLADIEKDLLLLEAQSVRLSVSGAGWQLEGTVSLQDSPQDRPELRLALLQLGRSGLLTETAGASESPLQPQPERQEQQAACAAVSGRQPCIGIGHEYYMMMKCSTAINEDHEALLLRHSNTLESLTLVSPGEKELSLALQMPNLSFLEVKECDFRNVLSLPELSSRATLRKLMLHDVKNVYDICVLLRAVRNSLRVLTFYDMDRFALFYGTITFESFPAVYDRCGLRLDTLYLDSCHAGIELDNCQKLRSRLTACLPSCRIICLDEDCLPKSPNF